MQVLYNASNHWPILRYSKPLTYSAIQPFLPNSALPCRKWKHIPPHYFPVEQGHNVPNKVRRDFFLKAFHCRWGIIYWGRCSKWRINVRSCHGWGSFTNIFFNNHFSFFQSWRYIHLKVKPWPKLGKYLYLKLILRGFKGCVMPNLTLTYL